MGEECASFLHAIFARPGRTKRALSSWGKRVGRGRASGVPCAFAVRRAGSQRLLPLRPPQTLPAGRPGPRHWAGGGGDHREGRVKEGEGQETARLEMVGVRSIGWDPQQCNPGPGWD